MADNNKAAGKKTLPDSEPGGLQFTPKVLDKTIIAIPLLERMNHEQDIIDKVTTKIKNTKEGKAPPKVPPLIVYDIVIDLHLGYRDPLAATETYKPKKAKDRVIELIDKLLLNNTDPKNIGVNMLKSDISKQYVFAALTGEMIRALVRLDKADDDPDPTKPVTTRSIYRIWPDFKVKAFITKSISTVKVDAARHSFSALGEGIVWAVIDSGIDKTHPHFTSLDTVLDIYSKDFTALGGNAGDPFNDDFGHGTHVAGILAGQLEVDKDKGFNTMVRQRDEEGNVEYQAKKETFISGMAPKCKLASLKVLDENGNGLASNLIVAIEYIQDLNGYGRDLKIHGVNMSLGYDFDPEWFACGQSPLCVEVDRLVKSGVVVVVAAGNTGYGYVKSSARNVVTSGLMLSINDPGNAELAITVGSTHRDMPHTYGVSYFSSKGPTGDGRKKPDLLAPGEKIISCAAGIKKRTAEENAANTDCLYIEDSGTSMAAPHVSGVIAAFLSIRKEYKGKPEQVKEIFLSTATDLKRDPYFQGHGLIDLMRAIQSV
ncbi:MAG: S8 family peptidase [Ferruginibacter sp.]